MLLYLFIFYIKQLFRSLVRLSCLLTQAKAFSGICSCIQALQVQAAGSSHSCLWRSRSRCLLPLLPAFQRHPWLWPCLPGTQTRVSADEHNRRALKHRSIVDGCTPDLCFPISPRSISRQVLKSRLTTSHSHTTYGKAARCFPFLCQQVGGDLQPLYSTLPSLFFQMRSKTNWDNSSELRALSPRQH